MSKPYNQTYSKKEQVREMFDSIAWRYDLLNHLLSMSIDRRWRRKVVDMVVKRDPKRILDVATGTADLAIMMAKHCHQATVEGVDISEKMLAVGAQKVQNSELTEKVHLRQGDAEALEWQDESFDIVTVAFGVRNFENIEKGIAEMFRVLNINGEIIILEFGMPRHKIFGMIYRFYFHRVLPFMGRLLSKDDKAYSYLPSSVEEFPYGDAFERMLEVQGFRSCTTKNLFGGVAQIYRAKKL